MKISGSAYPRLEKEYLSGWQLENRHIYDSGIETREKKSELSQFIKHQQKSASPNLISKDHYFFLQCLREKQISIWLLIKPLQKALKWSTPMPD